MHGPRRNDSELVRGVSSESLLYSIVLATKSLRNEPTVEGNNAMRLGLALLSAVVTTVETEEPVTSVAFTPDGQCLVVGCSNGQLRFWEIHNGREVAHLIGRNTLAAVLFSPNGVCLAAVGTDGGIDLWTTPSPLARSHTSAFGYTRTLGGCG